jgi:hypothetical protein
MISVSENFLVESEWFFFFFFFFLENKICPFLEQGVCIYVSIPYAANEEFIAG